MYEKRNSLATEVNNDTFEDFFSAGNNNSFFVDELCEYSPHHSP